VATLVFFGGEAQARSATAAVVDWFSSRVLPWRFLIAREAYFRIEALKEALAKNEKPENCNTDQGNQLGHPGDRSSSLGCSLPMKLSPRG
jgi:hypothetical protein